MTARTIVQADPPFAPGPTTRFYCPVPALETAFETLVLATVGRRPVTLLIGPSGSGKTTLLQRLINHWAEDGCLLLAVVAEPGMTVEAIIEQGAKGGQRSGHGLDDLIDGLERQLDACGTGFLVVDDADRLHPTVIAELVELSGSRTETGHYMQIILGGTPALIAVLSEKVDAPVDDVAAICIVPPLPAVQVADLIRHRLMVVGEAEGHPFSPSAIDVIAQSAHGRPGAAVLAAATVLDAAHANSLSRVDAAFARDALSPVGNASARPSSRAEKGPVSAPVAWQADTPTGGLSAGPALRPRDGGIRPYGRGRLHAGWTTLVVVLLLGGGGAWAGIEYAARIGLSLPGGAAPSILSDRSITTIPAIAPLATADLPPSVARVPPPPPPPAATEPQPDPREPRIRILVQRADRQIELKRLTTPPGDNALETIREIEQVFPGHDGAAQLRSQIAATYERWGRQAQARRQVEDARRFYTRALQATPDNATIRAMLLALDARDRGANAEDGSDGLEGSAAESRTSQRGTPWPASELPSYVQPIDFIGPEALIEALDRPDILRAVVGGGRDFDRPLPDGRTALMVAAATGRIPAMQVLIIEAKVGLDRRDPAGWTALMYAAASGQAEAARLLLSQGADRNLRNNIGQSAADLGILTPRGPLNLSQRR
jgi:type II secretory pathway predicted ATPase ExeA